MPNRSELAVRAMRSDSDDSAAEADAWLIIGLCAIGLLLSACLAIHAQPIADVPMLVAQYNLG